MIYIKLFIEFFKIGLFAIGGGLATIPFLQDLIGKYNWFTQNDLVDMIAVSQSTPGPIGINMATYVGYKAGGILGALVASFSLILPSFIIIIIIAHFFAKFNDNTIVKSAFNGLRPAVTGLIAAVGVEISKVSILKLDNMKNVSQLHKIFDYKALLLFFIILYFSNKYDRHPIFYIAISAFIGIIFKLG